jgi:hypothetical protein
MRDARCENCKRLFSHLAFLISVNRISVYAQNSAAPPVYLV